MKVVISAGHQPGLDSGATGQGRIEANDNILMCNRITEYLKVWGIDYDYMPNNVGDLTAETNWVNARYSLGQAYAIQIHRNAGGGTGNEVWTTAYQNQIPLATAILNSMTAVTGLKSRGVKDIKTSNWPLGWINHINCESVLIESRFIDKDSVTDTDAYLDAYAIACGIADFLKVPHGFSVEQIVDMERVKKLEAERVAKLAEEARLEALKQAQAKESADKQEADRIAAAKLAQKLADEKLAAEKLANEAKSTERNKFIDWLIQIVDNIISALNWRK